MTDLLRAHRGKGLWALVAAAVLALLITSAPGSTATASPAPVRMPEASAQPKSEIPFEEGKAKILAQEKRWATKPGVREMIEKRKDLAQEQEKPAVHTAGMSTSSVRSNVVAWARYYIGHYYDLSWGVEPCPPPLSQGIDCECLNRLAYYNGAGIQLTYTLQGQANTGYYVSNPRPGDLVFWDYDGDGYFDGTDHTGVYSGGGYAVHASTYYGETVETPVSWVSAEAYGTYYVRIL